MFKVIGGAVVYGFALYGVIKLFEDPVITSLAGSTSGPSGGGGLTDGGLMDDLEASLGGDENRARGALPIIPVL